MKKILFILSIVISSSCSKTDVGLEKDTCKLMTAVLSPTKKMDFEYEGDKIKTLTYTLENGEIFKLALSHNAEGNLSQVVGHYDGQYYITEKYSYTGNRISRTDYEYFDGFKGFNRIEYTAAGQISKFTYENIGISDYAYYTFAYDSEGSLIQTEEYAGKDDLRLRKIVKPVNSVKSPEKQLIAAGLPYDLYYGQPFKTLLGGDGTVIETYYPDANNELKLFTTGTVSGAKINAQNYLESYMVTVTGGNNFINNTSYTLIGCR